MFDRLVTVSNRPSVSSIQAPRPRPVLNRIIVTLQHYCNSERYVSLYYHNFSSRSRRQAAHPTFRSDNYWSAWPNHRQLPAPRRPTHHHRSPPCSTSASILAKTLPIWLSWSPGATTLTPNGASGSASAPAAAPSYARYAVADATPQFKRQSLSLPKPIRSPYE